MKPLPAATRLFRASLFFLPIARFRTSSAGGARRPPQKSRPGVEIQVFRIYQCRLWGNRPAYQYRGATPERHLRFPQRGAAGAASRPTPDTEVVIQLANESVGDSPSNALRDDLEVDWLFSATASRTALRCASAGCRCRSAFTTKSRTSVPALPFFRPSDNFYGEGTWTSDSVDGVVITHNFETGKPAGISIWTFIMANGKESRATAPAAATPKPTSTMRWVFSPG